MSADIRAVLPGNRLYERGDAGPARLSSDALLGPKGEIVIIHGGREYRLRVTQNGKLILTA